jgi:hypothetical protein
MNLERKKESDTTIGPVTVERRAPGNRLVDERRVFGTFVEGYNCPDLDNRYFTFPPQPLAYACNGHIPVVIFFPISGDKEDLLVDYDLAIIDFVTSNRVGKQILDANVTRILECFGNWDHCVENGGKAARPLRTEEVPLGGAVPLRHGQ